MQFGGSRGAAAAARSAPLPRPARTACRSISFCAAVRALRRVHHPPSARRPESAIFSHVTFIGRPPGWMLPGVAVASLSRTKRANISSVKPCASIIASVAPSGDPASKRAVPRLPPLCPGQALALWLFLPVRPSVGTRFRTGCTPCGGRTSAPARDHKIARWWHYTHDTSSDGMPLARMLPRVMAGRA
jgi:hypothetical protein